MMSLLRSLWVLSGVGVLLLVVLIWVFGPLLEVFGLRPLEGALARFAAILITGAVWGAANWLIQRKRVKADEALVEGAAAADPSEERAAEEQQAIRDKLGKALTLLRKARGTRGYLYEQPWYVIIGPPGAGKTTALLNAGLQFPLAAEMGQGAVAGVGGTRLCDWWFTDNAVLIDTAGRYTTQDSDASVDKAGWESFLDLLRRTRPRNPLNGVIVAISVADIAAAPKDERLAHARAIRRRVKELNEKLGTTLPVYALLTKADLLAGFTEFFDDLDKERRAQVWGTTFPLEGKGAGPLAAFGAEFRALVERLQQRLLDRLQAERSPERRALIAGFPAQVASLEAPLGEFLQEAFGGTRLDPAPFLRGVYLASGTQEGTPIDRLTASLARSFGVDQRRAPSLRPQAGRSYFLNRLVTEVIFGEAMLGARNPGAAVRRRAIAAAVWALALLGLVGGGFAVWQAQQNAGTQVAEADRAFAAYETAVKAAPTDPVQNGTDLPRVVPLLDQARALPFGPDAPPRDAAGFGFDQAEKFRAASAVVYRRALDRILLPRLIARLETQLRGALNQPDLLYEGTRVYLMLGNKGPMDAELVRTWMDYSWQADLPGPVNAPLRERLKLHLAAMLDGPLPDYPLDGALVQDARVVFSRMPLADRVYARIRSSAPALAVAAWTPAEAAGAAGVRVFTRGSGKPLTEGVPGFFTVDGFHRVLLPALGGIAKQVAEESWILGARQQLDPDSPQLRELEQAVIRLYSEEYIKVWREMIADLNTVPFRTIGQATQDLYLLSSPGSPMKELLVAIARQTLLTQPPEDIAKAQAEQQQQGQQGGGAAQRIAGVLGQAQAGQPQPDPPGKLVDDAFKPLRDAVGSGAGAAPIDLLLRAMNDLQQQLARLSNVQAAAPAAPTGIDPGQVLMTEAQRQPEPINRWIRTIAQQGNAMRGGGAKAAAAAAFNGPGGPAQLCRALAGRFPFARSQAEVPIDDFARLMAPGGALDAFFNTQLRPYVDTSQRTWRLQPMDGVAPPITPGDLAQFQRAATIRETFFPAGGTTPTVRFDIVPQDLDAGARQVTLDLDGVTVTYAHGPPRPTAITWPGQTGMRNLRLVFDPPPLGGGALQAQGPWALFRLFQQGQIRPTGRPEAYTVSFAVGERSATFQLLAGSVFNPFALRELTEFRCPALAP